LAMFRGSACHVNRISDNESVRLTMPRLRPLDDAEFPGTAGAPQRHASIIWSHHTFTSI
jgi:hypothetical protein